jgi:hypothetical protein
MARMTLASPERSCARALIISAMLMMVTVFLVSVGLDWRDLDEAKPVLSPNGKGPQPRKRGEAARSASGGSKQPWTLDATG